MSQDTIKVEKIDFDDDKITSKHYYLPGSFASDNIPRLVIESHVSMRVAAPKSWNDMDLPTRLNLQNSTASTLEKQLVQYLKDIKSKAEKFDFIAPWLRKNLTEEQLNELSVIADPLSRRILAYLASGEK